MHKPFFHFIIEDSVFKNDDAYLHVGENVFHWEIQKAQNFELKEDQFGFW